MKTVAENQTVAVVGLGYVGLPLAVAFAKAGLSVIGFDVSAERVRELAGGRDRTGEADPRDLNQAALSCTNDAAKLRDADFIIVAVPTPVHEDKTPDLGPLEKASATVGQNLKPGAIIVYESTVWPGLTEEHCVPIIEKCSGKTCGRDFLSATLRNASIRVTMSTASRRLQKWSRLWMPRRSRKSRISTA